MYTANPYNIYKQNSVNMASSQQLLLMLLDGAVKYTKIARMAILNKDIARAHKELVRVQDIFLELMITMDKNTKYMEDLYNICLLYTSPSPRDLSTSRMPSSA